MAPLAVAQRKPVTGFESQYHLLSTANSGNLSSCIMEQRMIRRREEQHSKCHEHLEWSEAEFPTGNRLHKAAIEWCREVRRRFPEVRILVGGLEFTIRVINYRGEIEAEAEVGRFLASCPLSSMDYATKAVTAIREVYLEYGIEDMAKFLDGLRYSLVPISTTIAMSYGVLVMI